jgi:hypothetical protein
MLTILGIYLVVGGIIGMCFAWKSFLEYDKTTIILYKTVCGILIGPVMLIVTMFQRMWK